MIVIAKLVSREFVIGRYVDLILTNVALLSFTSNSVTGESGVKIIPYMHPVSSSLAKLISVDKIMSMEAAPTQLQAAYLELIKSIIEKSQESVEPVAPVESSQQLDGNHD